MLIAYPCISELEQMLFDNMNLLAQERQSYPPYLFWSGSDCLWHILFLAQPAEKIYARIRYSFSQAAQKYHFYDYLVIRERQVLGRIDPHSRNWDPDLIGAEISQMIPLEGPQNGLLLTWDCGGLRQVEVCNGGCGYGPKNTEDAFLDIEMRTGLELPREIDMVQKAQEVLDVSGYRDFFRILVGQTPCKFCQQVLASHNETTGHSYEPFLIYQNFNTFCKVCGVCQKDHNSPEHQFDPDFSASQPFVYLPGYFSQHR